VNPRLSEVLNKFKIVLKDRTVYSGRAVVRNVVDAGLRIVCEATLDEAHWMEVNPDWVAQGGGRLTEEFKAFLGEWQKLYRVLPEYKIAHRRHANLLRRPANLAGPGRGWFAQLPDGSRRQLEAEVTQAFAQVVIPPVNELFKSLK